jgi:predicted secreted protein
MTFALALTAVAVFLSTAAIVILAILVAGIRSEDRTKNLTRAPRTRTEHLTRRLVGVGVRTAGADHATAMPPGTTPSSPVVPESDRP